MKEEEAIRDKNFKVEHLLEQYKLYVQMADNISNRRAQANTFYITVLSGFLALIPVIDQLGLAKSAFFLFCMGVIGLTLCGVWFVTIQQYRQLNSGKFQVIHDMEKQLPFACYEIEWNYLTEGERKYKKLTRVEQFVPVILSLPYLFMIIYSLWKFLFK